MRTLARGLVLGALCLTPVAAGAGAPARSEIGVETSIDACWAASHEDLHSDSTLRVARGASAVIACLEYQIVILVAASLECVPECGTGWNNVGALELAERLDDLLRELAARRNKPVTYDEDVRDFIAAMRAGANEETTVFVRLDEKLNTVDSMVNSVIGVLDMPCNLMWNEGCEIPMEPLVRLLRDAGAQLPAVGLPCDRATLDTLEACLPGFEVSSSPDGEQVYLTTRRS